MPDPACVRAQVGTKKSWRDSLFLRVGGAVLLKVAAFPLACRGIKGVLELAGGHWLKGKKVPDALFIFAFETGAKKLGAPL